MGWANERIAAARHAKTEARRKSAKWRQENLEAARAYAREWRARNRERVKTYNDRWKSRDPEGYAAMRAKANRRYVDKQREDSHG